MFIGARDINRPCLPWMKCRASLSKGNKSSDTFLRSWAARNRSSIDDPGSTNTDWWGDDSLLGAKATGRNGLQRPLVRQCRPTTSFLSYKGERPDEAERNEMPDEFYEPQGWAKETVEQIRGSLPRLTLEICGKYWGSTTTPNHIWSAFDDGGDWQRHMALFGSLPVDQPSLKSSQQ